MGFGYFTIHEPLNVMLVTFGLLILEDLVAFIWGGATTRCSRPIC